MSLMQRIPLHAKEVKIFKPDCLREQSEIPAFTLKAATRQHREDMAYAMREAGLRQHRDEALREVTVEELCRLWGCTETDEQVERLKSYWQSLDDYNDDVVNRLAEIEAVQDGGGEAPADIPPFEHPDTVFVADLLDRLDRRSERLRRLAIDNAKFSRALPRYAVAHCVTGWSGLQIQPQFEGELLTIGAVYELEEELENRFGDLGEAAMAELATAAIGRLFLSKEAEKNSESGPASQQTPAATKATGSGKANGASLASGTSAETLAE